MKKSYLLISLIFFVFGFMSCNLNIANPRQEIDVQVQIYFQNIDNDDYTLGETRNIKGTIGSFTNLQAPDFPGFIAKDVLQILVESEDAVASLYYDRIISTVVLHANNGAFNGEETVVLEGRYEQNIDYQIPEKHDYLFAGWTDVKGKKLEISKFGLNSEELYASWKACVSYNLTFDICDGRWTDDYIVPNNYIEGFEKSLPFVEKNFNRTGYIFDGWYTDREYSASSKLDMIETYTKGDLILYAKWIPATDTPYKVIHKLQAVDLKDYILKESEEKIGTTDSYTDAQQKNYNGFTCCGFMNKKINANGSTEVEILYDRNNVTVTYTSNLGKITSQSGYYEDSYTQPDLTRPGYTYTINDYSKLTSYPANDIIIHVSYIAKTDTEYTITTKTQNVDGRTFEVTKEKAKGTTDTKTSVIAENKPGFYISSVTQTNIYGDGTGEVVITYYRKSITVIYSDGRETIKSTGLYGANITNRGYWKVPADHKIKYSSNITTYPAESTVIKVIYESNSTTFVNKTWQIHGPFYANLQIGKYKGTPFIDGNTIYVEALSDIYISFSSDTFSEGAQSGWYSSHAKALLTSTSYQVFLVEERSSTNIDTETLLESYDIRYLYYPSSVY